MSIGVAERRAGKKPRQFKVRSRPENGCRTVTVTWDSGGMNTLSSTAVAELSRVVDLIDRYHQDEPIRVVYLKGNRHGLGAGADINELSTASKPAMKRFIKATLRLLYAIERSPVRWVAVVDGVCLGGVYELALACDAIVASAKSKIGFPEIDLHIFPGAGGPARSMRKAGIPAALEAVLSGKHYSGIEAQVMGLIDAVVPNEVKLAGAVGNFVAHKLPARKRNQRLNKISREDFLDFENQLQAAQEIVNRRTRGRLHPKAPYAALEVMRVGAKKPLPTAIAFERASFLNLVVSDEAKAGMRHFFTGQKLKRYPGQPSDLPRQVERVAIAGADGFMGNAFLFLTLMSRKNYQPVAWVPDKDLTSRVYDGLKSKFEPLVKRGKLSQQVADGLCDRVMVTDDIHVLGDCDLVIECLLEDEQVKAGFFGRLGRMVTADMIVGSNSSSMGPGILCPYFVEAGGKEANFVNTHGFSPYEHPAVSLNEIICGKNTSGSAVATMWHFITSLGKTPIICRDGSTGFAVNSMLFRAALEAENIYAEGTPISVIDRAIRDIFPVGPFELLDSTGLTPLEGSYKTLANELGRPVSSVIGQLIGQGRISRRNGGGFYSYGPDGKAVGEWEGLASLFPTRGSAVASVEEIRHRYLMAMYHRGCELVASRIVSSANEVDFAAVTGLGMASELGGPIFYGQRAGGLMSKQVAV